MFLDSTKYIDKNMGDLESRSSSPPVTKEFQSPMKYTEKHGLIVYILRILTSFFSKIEQLKCA